MDLVMKGRGIRITDQVRRTAEHKLAKIGRLDPKVLRLEVELTLERNPRIGGSYRVEVACDTARQTFRAGAVRVGVLTAARSLGGRLPARCYRLPDGLRPGSVVARETFSR